jgi:S1-C subfamily serine protease
MANNSVLTGLSSELADLVENVGRSVVRIDDGSRLTASGFVWSSDGIIAASSHGVERDENLFVELYDGSRLPASVAGRDPDTDTVALRVDAPNLIAPPRMSADNVRVGEIAIAIGRPGEGGLQASIGLVTARLETESLGQIGYILYTDAVLYPGFSGSPLVNVGGGILGMNNLGFGRGRGVAVGSPVLEQVITALVGYGRIRHSYLGIRTQSVALSEPVRQAAQLEQTIGLLISQVDLGSPAERAGVLLGDTMLRLDGQVLNSTDDLRTKLRATSAGQTVTVQVLRGGAIQDLRVTVEERK